MNIKACTGLCLGMWFTTAVLAAGFPVEFETLDGDSDGYISLQEAKQRSDLYLSFRSVDVDTDNKISISEYQAYESKGRFAPPEESEIPELGAAIIE